MNKQDLLLAAIALLLVITTQKPAFTQNTGNINEKINISQDYTWELMYVDSALTKISNAVIVNAGINLIIGNPYNTISKNYFFLVNGQDVYPFQTYEELFQSPQFVETIQPAFRLQNQEDGLNFLSFLYLIDQYYFHDGYFIQDNDWYFVRREFFDDLRGWKVNTDGNGKILTIEYSDELPVTKPGEMLEAGNQIRYSEQPPMPEIAEQAHRNMEAYGISQLNYSFEERTIEPLVAQKITTAPITELSVLLISQFEDYTSTDRNIMWVLEYDEGTEVYSHINDALVSDEFIESMAPSFSMKTREDALVFESFLDAVTDFDSREKKAVQKDNTWFFIRSQPFDDGRGFVVTTNDAGKIESLRYDDRIDLEAEPEEPFDESTADWGFQLVEPQNNKVSVVEGASVNVQIAFNENPVNRMGAWILTRVNGENQGMAAGTKMYSPFTDEISGSYLGAGNHTIEYMLLRPGMDPENPLATISIEVEVKAFDPEGIDWEFKLLKPAQTEFVAEPGVEIPVKISFNQQAVKENGAFILVSYMGEIVDGEKPEHMESPFDASIPGAVLTRGVHQISFLLMPPGSEDPERALDKITLNIEVK